MGKAQKGTPAKASPKKAAPRFADAAGVATSGQTSLGPAIEKAMSDAIAKATEQGVSDPAEIQKRMMAARQAVVDAAAKEAAAEAARQKAMVEGK